MDSDSKFFQSIAVITRYCLPQICGDLLLLK